MPYRFRFATDEPITEGVRRIALEQIGDAIGELTCGADARADAVHQVRKRLKKLRGLLRLVRGHFAEFGRENACFRDAARKLAASRDAETVVAACAALLRRYPRKTGRRFAGVLEALVARRRSLTGTNGGAPPGHQQALEALQEARERIDRWEFSAEEFELLQPGLVATCRRGRRAMKRALKTPSDANLHEWRKQVKNHWYHVRLLQPAAPRLLRRRRAIARRLGEALGDDHDLAVLRGVLRGESERFEALGDVPRLIELLERRRRELVARAERLGRKLHATSPKKLCRRLEQRWKRARRRRGVQIPTYRTVPCS